MSVKEEIKQIEIAEDNLNLDSDAKFVEQFFELWINPEIVRRRETNRLPGDFTLYAAQVVMNYDAPTEVRLNQEVKATVKGKSGKPFVGGEEISLEDLDSIQGIELTDYDPNAGHFTLLSHRGNWLVRYDFRYNASRSRNHLQAAREFLDSATFSIGKGHMRAFADSMFSAVELMAKGFLLMHNKTMLTSKKHPAVHVAYNRWGHLGNTNSRYTKLLNRLSALRGPARYLDKDLSLATDKAKNMLAVAEEMFADLRARIPVREKRTHAGSE